MIVAKASTYPPSVLVVGFKTKTRKGEDSKCACVGACVGACVCMCVCVCVCVCNGAENARGEGERAAWRLVQG